MAHYQSVARLSRAEAQPMRAPRRTANVLIVLDIYFARRSAHCGARDLSWLTECRSRCHENSQPKLYYSNGEFESSSPGADIWRPYIPQGSIGTPTLGRFPFINLIKVRGRVPSRCIFLCYNIPGIQLILLLFWSWPHRCTLISPPFMHEVFLEG